MQCLGIGVPSNLRTTGEEHDGHQYGHRQCEPGREGGSPLYNHRSGKCLHGEGDAEFPPVGHVGLPRGLGGLGCVPVPAPSVATIATRTHPVGRRMRRASSSVYSTKPPATSATVAAADVALKGRHQAGRYCLSQTTVFTAWPCAFVPVVVYVIVLPSGEMTTRLVAVCFPSTSTMTSNERSSIRRSALGFSCRSKRCLTGPAHRARRT